MLDAGGAAQVQWNLRYRAVQRQQCEHEHRVNLEHLEHGVTDIGTHAARE